MKKVYFISGLGADSRSFGFLNLSFCDARFVEWVAPLPTDTMESYAEKLFASINDENAIIAGVSFGGMLATEIAKKHPGTKVIIISSSKTFMEIPKYLRFWRHLPVYKWNSEKVKNFGGEFVLNIIGAKGEDQKKVQRQIMKDTDTIFMRWAVHAIVNWKNTTVPENVIHIHGTADKLLPYRYVKAHYTITGGEHLMLMDKAAEVSQLLQQLIAN